MTDPQFGSASADDPGASPPSREAPPGQFTPGQYPPGYPSGGSYPPPGPFPPPSPGQYPPPPPGQYPPPVDPYGYAPPPGAYYDSSAPYGRHPVTGEALSDKSKVIAGLLQLLGILGFLGFGRMYIGQVGLGVAQLLIGLIGGVVLGLLTCGLGFALPAIWGVIDAVLMLTGNVRDSYGRPLRDGT